MANRAPIRRDALSDHLRLNAGREARSTTETTEEAKSRDDFGDHNEVLVDFLERQTDLQAAITREPLSKGLPKGWRREERKGADNINPSRDRYSSFKVVETEELQGAQ